MSKRTYYTAESPRFSRDWWLRTGRTFFWVALVTVLVWVYADIEFTDRMELRATVQLRAGRGENLVIVAPMPPSVEVSFTLRGSRSRLEQLRRELVDDYSSTIVYDVTERYGPGEHDIPVSEILHRWKNLEREGVSLQMSNPQQIRVVIDDRVGRMLPVRLRAEGGVVARNTIDPPQVEVFALRSVWRQIDEAVPEASRVIFTEPVNLRNYPADREVALQVPLAPFVGDTRVQLATERVQARFEIQRLTEEREYSVSVRVLMPPIWADDGTWRRYKLTYDKGDWRKTIRVVGTKIELDALKPEDIDAYITLTDQDKVAVESSFTREVTFRFPKALSVQLAPAQKRENLVVQFKLEPDNGPIP